MDQTNQLGRHSIANQLYDIAKLQIVAKLALLAQPLGVTDSATQELTER